MALTKITSTVVEDSGVTGGSYGSSSQVPVITVNDQGIITAASTTAVAGVSNVTYDTATGILTVSTSAGTDYNVDLSVGSSDSLTLSGLTVNGATTVGGHIVPDTDITYDLGSATNRFRDLYLSSATIYLGDVKISKNETTGKVDILAADDTPIDLGNNYNVDAVDAMIDDLITEIESLATTVQE